MKIQVYDSLEKSQKYNKTKGLLCMTCLTILGITGISSTLRLVLEERKKYFLRDMGASTSSQNQGDK